MAGLEDATVLRHLCLYSNEITKIEHLDHLSELEVLWLNDNKISVIEVSIVTTSVGYVRIFIHSFIFTVQAMLARY